MARHAGEGAEQNAPPSSYPMTPPPPSASPDSWVMTAINRMEGTLGKLEATLIGVQAQLNRVETHLVEIDKEVIGHGRWMHTLKAFAGVLALMIAWVFANAVWPWLRRKIGIPAP